MSPLSQLSPGTLAQIRRAQARLFTKRVALHGAILSLMAIIALQGRAVSYQGSPLLYALAAQDEIIEGPFNAAVHAQESAPGVGGARLAAVDSTQAPAVPIEEGDTITFEDPEVAATLSFSETLATAPLTPTGETPVVPAASSADTTSPRQPSLYTVQSGDTVASIAATFNLKTTTVLWANGLDSTDVINVGDRLTILPTDGVLHTIRSGDTVSELASTYDVTASEIVSFNDLGDNAALKIGAKIIIPGGEQPEITRLARQRDTTTSAPDPETPAETPTTPVTGDGWLWPTATKHISQYFNGRHTGIDIDSRARPPVAAAEGGSVQFAGWFGGYGKLVILNHGNGLQTYYGHLQTIGVEVGQSVAKGQSLGQMGSTGRSTGPHLHFELRRNGRPVNPLGIF